MTTYELIITDVTCYGNLYCVAGWDVANGCMIRPEPPGANAAAEASRFWNAEWVGAGKFFSVGNVVRLDASAPPQNFPFPHATEDRLYVQGPNSTVLRQHTLTQLAQTVRAGLSDSLAETFGGELVRANSGKAYVPAGTPTCSLDAIEVTPDQISFYQDSPSGKPRLRAVITQDGVNYDLSVPADAARARFLAAGLATVEADAQASNLVHIRLGLCRPFAAMPNACYAQVNGLYFL
jgi:hypothetical protein